MREFTHMRRFAHFRSNCRHLPKTFRGSGAWNGQPHAMPDLGWTDNRNVGVRQSVRDAGGAVPFWELSCDIIVRGASEGIGSQLRRSEGTLIYWRVTPSRYQLEW
jgi:hypothetical protein